MAQDVMGGAGEVSEQNTLKSRMLPKSIMAHIGSTMNKTCAMRRSYMQAHVGSILKDYPQAMVQAQLGTQFTGVQITGQQPFGVQPTTQGTWSQ
jgi:hypothetical protein